jgi:hypothetical protein
MARRAQSEKYQKPLCVKTFFGARGSSPLAAGVALLLGPGCDRSEVPVFRVQAGRAGFRVAPDCPPRARYITRCASATRARYTASLMRRFNARSASFFDFPSSSLRWK